MINNNCTLCEGRGFTTYFREGYEFAKKCDCVSDSASITKNILKETIKSCNSKKSKSFFKKILSQINSTNSFENVSLSSLLNIKPTNTNYLKTGIYNIDKLHSKGSLATSNLHLIIGDANSGKSSLIEHIALTNAKNKKKTAIFSLDNTKENIFARFQAKTSGVSLNKILTKTINSNDYKKFHDAAYLNRLSYSDFYTIDSKDNHIGTILSDIYTLSVDDGIEVFFIDCIQQLLMPNNESIKSILEYNAISFLLTTIIKKLNITIFAVSQKNASINSNKRNDSLYINSMSCSLAQSAATIISTSIRDLNNNNVPKKIMKVKIEKNRYLKPGTTAEVLFDQDTTKIINIF